MLHPGDVYIKKTPDGRYAAVRVIRTLGKSAIICTTEYLGQERPSLDDPSLKKTVIQKRFFYQSEPRPAMEWLEGVPPKIFEFLGQIPATEDEEKTVCNVIGGGWCESSGNEAYMEWRWIHDRSAFEEEVRKEKEEFDRRNRQPQKPKKMMSEDVFWSIINLLDWKHQGNDEKVLVPAIKALASKTVKDINQFHERLAYFLYQLDTKAHASNIGEDSYIEESNYLSADGFLYARCVVVANGNEFYESVLKDPKKMPKDLEFESLLGIASTAYELKTGKDFDYSTGCSYETFSNPTGWKK